jgi:tRNA(Ile)-lysidine synthase
MHIGLAISGGVDSMALATLYAKFWNSFLERGSNNDVTPPPELRGFVVNHKVRPESTEEARWVAEQLRTQRKYAG